MENNKVASTTHNAELPNTMQDLSVCKEHMRNASSWTKALDKKLLEQENNEIPESDAMHAISFEDVKLWALQQKKKIPKFWKHSACNACTF